MTEASTLRTLSSARLRAASMRREKIRSAAFEVSADGSPVVYEPRATGASDGKLTERLLRVALPEGGLYGDGSAEGGRRFSSYDEQAVVLRRCSHVGQCRLLPSSGLTRKSVEGRVGDARRRSGWGRMEGLSCHLHSSDSESDSESEAAFIVDGQFANGEFESGTFMIFRYVDIK